MTTRKPTSSSGTLHRSEPPSPAERLEADAALAGVAAAESLRAIEGRLSSSSGSSSVLRWRSCSSSSS